MVRFLTGEKRNGQPSDFAVSAAREPRQSGIRQAEGRVALPVADNTAREQCAGRFLVGDSGWLAISIMSIDPTELFIDGKVDAFLGSPPKPQRLRARSIGHTILNMTTDPPWSQHFCCTICGSAVMLTVPTTHNNW
jgi:hypothetical protein